jgi:DNA-binding MarR family transcriptional regulator
MAGLSLRVVYALHEFERFALADATLGPRTRQRSSEGEPLLTTQDSQPNPLKFNAYASRAARDYADAFDWSDPTAIEAVISVNLTNSAQVAAMGRLCDSLGISRTIGRYQLLRILYFTPEHRLTQVEVAGEMQVTSANVTFLVDGLEKDDLVRRVPSLTDRRTVYVELTDSGQAFAERIVPSLAGFMGAMLEDFSDAEKRQLSELLDRVRRNAERYHTRSLD